MEGLGVFYLGRGYDLDAGEVSSEPLLYDARDLTTHAVCLGMTGSGKTGLCATLLEEAALDGVPALVIDPKGDLGNLLLTFPELRGEDFAPWVDPDEARRAGQGLEEHAAAVAERWRTGLARWGQGPERIRRLRDAVHWSIFTPGSTAGQPLSVFQSLQAPPRALIDDGDALLDRVRTASAGVLALVGLEGDPLRSREHILLANILERAFRAGQDLDLAELVRQVRTPPFERLGVLELEAFYPKRARFQLATQLNNLLAAPGFSTWLQGEPLDISKLLHTAAGKPRVSIFSIAHLTDAERMFFVTTLLSELVGWMRTQPGTSSLRALLYMDEVYGFLPPTAMPPSKRPLLTLLKQARAVGLGVVLATQNPVDLDYKALSNAGTWFLGRLQTERDRARVLDGLQGTAGAGFDQRALERSLAGLSKRVFLLHNVHEPPPVAFHSRWAMTYLRGPLTRAQIRRLVPAAAAPAAPLDVPADASSSALRDIESQAPASTPPAAQATFSGSSARPVSGSARPAAPAPLEPGAPALDPDLSVVYLPAVLPPPAGQRLVYRPTLLAVAWLHYARARLKVDEWQSVTVLAAPPGGPGTRRDWSRAVVLQGEARDLAPEPIAGAEHAPLPDTALSAKAYSALRRGLVAYLYRARRLSLLRCPSAKLVSAPGEPEGAFRARVGLRLHELRDDKLAALRRKYGGRLERARERMFKAQQRLQREQEQLGERTSDAMLSAGGALLGALWGRKLISQRKIGGVTRAVRSARRVSGERADVARARERLLAARDKVASLEAELRAALQELRARTDPEAVGLEPIELSPRKADIRVELLALGWVPWALGGEQVPRPICAW